MKLGFRLGLGLGFRLGFWLGFRLGLGLGLGLANPNPNPNPNLNCDRSAFQGPNGLFSKRSALVRTKTREEDMTPVG